MTDRAYPFNFDGRKVIDAFGGVRSTHQRLKEIGCEISQRAVRKWLERRTVPSDAILALHFATQDNGGPNVLDLVDRGRV
jgi:hypothetical protein